MRALRRGAAIAAVLAAAVIVATGPASAGPVIRVCPTHHIRTLAHDGSVRVIVDLGHTHLGAHRILACQSSNGIEVGQLLVQPDDQNDHVISALVVGHYAALVQNRFASDGDGQVNVVVANATKHQIFVRAFGSGDPDGVVRAVLGQTGTIAWVDGDAVLHAALRGGPTDGCIFDHGPVTASSVHRSPGNTLTWTVTATLHHAPLTSAGCVP